MAKWGRLLAITSPKFRECVSIQKARGVLVAGNLRVERIGANLFRQRASE